LPFAFNRYYLFYLNNKRLTYASKAFLVFVSLFFYSWWNIAYLPIILVSMLFNYVIGLNLSDNNVHQKLNKKLVLSIGIVANISLLGYFKYADFLIENINMISNGMSSVKLKYTTSAK
jgi:D-alanyl-lipoteichoic acid acyltransferase DltB (MBOAT superfamily)